MASPLATVLASAYQQAGLPGEGRVNPTDISSIVANSQDAAYKNYAAKLGQQNAMFGGLAGLGSAGVLSFGPKLAGKLFGAGGTTAAAGDAAATGGAVADATGATAADTAPFWLSSVTGDAGATLGADAALSGIADAAPVAATVAADAAAPVVADAGAGWLASVLPFLFV